MKCKILPNNKRLKQLVKEHGEVWNQLTGIEFPHCFNGEPAVLIESLDRSHKRWVGKDCGIFG